MAKYLGIPLTVSNGNKVPLTAQPQIVNDNNFKVGTTANWTEQTGWNIDTSAGTATFTGGIGSPTNLVSMTNSQKVLTTGKAYQMEIVIDSIDDGSIRIWDFIYGTVYGVFDSPGKYVVNVIAKSHAFSLRGVSSSVVVSYVAVKEIAATETPTYGSSEYVTNGEFADDSDWTITHGGWDASGPSSGSWACDGTQTQSSNLAQPNVFQGLTGKKVVISFEITAYTAGSVRFITGDSTIIGSAKSRVGTHETIGVVTNDATGLNIQADPDFVGSVSNVSVKEIPYVMGTEELVKNGSFATDTVWEKIYGATISDGRANIIGDGTTFTSINQDGVFTQGKVYELVVDITIKSGLGLKFQQYGYNQSIGSATQTGVYTFQFEAISNSGLNIGRKTGGTPFESYVNSVSVKEVEYNYLQVSDGGFKKSVKEGDVVFNTSTGTEGVVKEVIDNNVLLMSNDNFSTADEFFNVFAANGDTRGNQLIKTDNYIMSEYDENTSNPQKSSFWFAGGKNSDKVVLTQLNPATNTFFVAGVIEEYLERLNSQSATDSRLDIPLDAFRDHQYNETLTTTAITLS